MKVFLAGAGGAVGRPLVVALLEAGHDVTGTTRSPDRVAALRAAGVEPVVLDAFDAAAVRAAVLAARPEVVVHQLTALPANATPAALKKAFPLTARLRRETVPVFAAAAAQAGARRLVVQSIAFVTPPSGPPDHDESAPLWLDCPDAGFRATIEAIRDMEAAALGASEIEGVVLRYAFFYGPGTWYERDGTIGQMVRKRRYPVIGDGAGRNSFVHVDDAAAATVLALDRGAPGVYNIADDEPVTARDYLHEIAALVGAKRPLHVPAFVGRRAAGATTTHYATTLRGAANGRARAALGFAPRARREGFAQAFGA